MASKCISRNVLLSKKLSEKGKESCSFENTQLSLVAVVDDNILVWSREDCCFYAQALEAKDATVQTLHVTRPPLWTVQRISVNKSGTGVLLVGRRGVGVVDLPQRWGKDHAFDGGRETITCRIEYVAERFLVCQQKVCVAAAQWHPGSPNQNHIVILASDHYLRVYSLRSRDVPDQAFCITAARPSNIFSTQSSEGRLGGPMLGEDPVDFTIGTPFVPKMSMNTDVGQDSPIAQTDLQWPCYILYGNGDVYHVSLSLHHHKLRSRAVSGPLLMHPARQDNYGLEWCSVGWLGQSNSVEGVGAILALATSGGKVYHCIVMPPRLPPSAVKAEEDNKAAIEEALSSLRVSTAPVSLFVYESVELDVSLIPEEELKQQPLMLTNDHSTPSRYFVVHSCGVHAVTVTLVDSLRNFSATDDNNLIGVSDDECECTVDHLVCTRSLPSAPALPVVGSALWTKRELLVLLSSGSIVSVPLSTVLPYLPVPQNMIANKTKENRPDGKESFETVIANVLQRKSSQPLLVSSTAEALLPAEALDLTNRTLHTLRTEYIDPQAEAQQLIIHRIKVLYEQQKALCDQVSSLQNQRLKLVEQNEKLQQKQQQAQSRQENISQRLDAVVACALRGVPGLSGGERWFLKQLQSIQEQIPHLNNDIENLQTKLHWHTTNLKDANSEAGDNKELKLSQNQLHLLKKNIGAETSKIESLVGRINEVKKNLES